MGTTSTADTRRTTGVMGFMPADTMDMTDDTNQGMGTMDTQDGSAKVLHYGADFSPGLTEFTQFKGSPKTVSAGDVEESETKLQRESREVRKQKIPRLEPPLYSEHCSLQ